MHPFLSKWCFLRFKNKRKCVCLSFTQTTMIHIKPMDMKSEDDSQRSSKMIFQKHEDPTSATRILRVEEKFQQLWKYSLKSCSLSHFLEMNKWEKDVYMCSQWLLCFTAILICKLTWFNHLMCQIHNEWQNLFIFEKTVQISFCQQYQTAAEAF